MKRSASVFLLIILMLVPALALLQGAPVTAEAILEANLRANTSVESDLVGNIQSGTLYPVVGRSEFFPWYLIADPQTQAPLGWVFADLVNVRGDINTVPFSEQIIGAAPTATPTLQASAPPPDASASATSNGLSGVALPATPTATALPAVSGRVEGEVNIRYGPGIEYPRVGVARAGEVYEITAYHTQFPWVQLRFPEVAGGFGWVAIDLLDIQGNIYNLPGVSRTQFDLPTLTPTPNAVQASALVDADLSPEFQALGESIWQEVLEAGFEPETSRFGSLYLMNLQTGEALTFGSDIAYSGTSLSKIGILVSTYARLDALPTGPQARQLANMMICSENTSSNEMLTLIGGDPYSGATGVTSVLSALGLENTFMTAPFLIDPRITPQPAIAPVTAADQARANPDPFNQITVEELGWLLGSMYQCATDGTGPFIESLDGAINQRECQQMLYLMSGNKIGALLEASVPANTRIAHKHGWINDTHGDAGIVFTPGGDYVFVMVLHNPTWLNFEESFPLIEGVALDVYNHFNPEAPLSATRSSDVPETCDLTTAEGVQIIDTIARGGYE